MSSYFDDKVRAIAKLAQETTTDVEFLAGISAIEREAFQTISLVTGDREFPDDLRQCAMKTFAVDGVFSNGGMEPLKMSVQYVLATRSSRCLEALHSLFHEVARRHVLTRFGHLSDNPPDILARRDEFDAECYIMEM